MPSSRESRLAPVQGSFIILTPQSKVIKQKWFNCVLFRNFFLGPFHPGEGEMLGFSLMSRGVFTSNRLLQILTWSSQERGKEFGISHMHGA